MSTEQKVVYNSSGGGMFLLFIIFLVLKLTGVIAWSWWWVTAPLWGPLALVLGILAVVGTGMLAMFLSLIVWEYFRK